MKHNEEHNRKRREICNRYEKTPKGFLMRLYRNMKSRVKGVQQAKHHLYEHCELLRKVADDLALIWSGQSVGAQPNGAQMALDYVRQYTQKQSIQQRLAADPEYAEALTTYIEQYEFQLDQQQNAVTGRIGTAPAELQGVNT